MKDKLSHKQEKFAQTIAGGLMNASDAYRVAYDATKMSGEVIHVKASELLKNGKVTVRIRELQAQLEPLILEKLLISKEMVIDELEEIRLTALRNNQCSAAVAATMGKAKVLGYLTDKIEAHFDARVTKSEATLADYYKELRRKCDE